MRITVLAVLCFLYASPSLAQKAFKLINRGKYEKAEQLSRSMIRQSKEYDRLNPGGRYTFHKLSRRVVQYHALARVYLLKGDLAAAELNYHRADSAHVAFQTYHSSKKAINWRDFLIKVSILSDLVKSRQDRWSYDRSMDVAGIYIRLGEMDSAKHILDETYHKMKLIYGEKFSMAKSVYSTYGRYYQEAGNYDSSTYFYKRYILSLYSDPMYFDLSVKRLSDAYAGLAAANLGSNDIAGALYAAKKAKKFAYHRFARATDGKNIIGKINTANLLAEAHRRNNDYKTALQWNTKAYDLLQRHVRVSTPEKLPVLATRGQAYWALGDTLAANAAFRELMDVFFGYTQNNFSFLPEAERQYFYRKNKHLLDLTKSYYHYLYFTKGYRDDYIARSLYEIHINNKGVLLSSASKLLNVLFAKGDPALLSQYATLKENREKKNRALQTGDAAAAAVLDAEIGRIEKELRQVLSIRPEDFVSTDQITKAIPDSTQLVDILKCRLMDVVTDPATDVTSLVDRGENRYLYFLLDNKSNLKLLRNELDESNLEQRLYKGYLNFARLNLQRREVYDAYFGPFAKELTSRRVILSTDGIYNLINPEIIFDGSQYLADRFEFQSVVSSKDILRLALKTHDVKDITLVGRPDYSTHKRLYDKSPADLPGTEREISAIRQILPATVNTQVFMRNQANEMIVKDIESTSVLHFATHGFFEASKDKEPMYTSGLVLALSDSVSRSEDGFLTAYEASNLELNKTFLVVLSACETGQGEFEDGEGVWGLQRAFQVAGVRYIVMSLFKVDDDVTASLMKQFYSNMIAGDEVLTAFRKAQRDAKSKYPRPVDWGAFVIKGF